MPWPLHKHTGLALGRIIQIMQRHRIGLSLLQPRIQCLCLPITKTFRMSTCTRREKSQAWRSLGGEVHVQQVILILKVLAEHLLHLQAVDTSAHVQQRYSNQT